FSDSEVRTTLAEAQCIELGGEDARAFAQAQFSGDVRALQPLHWHWNAWLDHKGGVRALMHLADAGDGRLLALLRGGDAEMVCAELRKYVLRAKVRIEPLRDRFLSIGPPLPLHALHGADGAIGFGHGECGLWVETTQRATIRSANANSGCARSATDGRASRRVAKKNSFRPRWDWNISARCPSTKAAIRVRRSRRACTIAAVTSGDWHTCSVPSRCVRASRCERKRATRCCNPSKHGMVGMRWQ